jgi:anti-sigma factor RsiW
MNCEETKRFLDAYLDRELDLRRYTELEQHLSLCPSCHAVAQELEEFRALFMAGAQTLKAPPGLRANVLAAVRREQAKQSTAFWRQPWVYAAAVVILSLFLALNILLPDAGGELSRQAVFLHAQSLGANHPVDVTSANPQVVKSWLTAKLDFVPPVVGFPAWGYSLFGGRVDVIQNRSVAALVYKHDQDVVTLFCWPPKKEKGRLSKSDHLIEGYHVSTWSNAECNYILVSKLSDREMEEFVDSFRVHVQSGAYF